MIKTENFKKNGIPREQTGIAGEFWFFSQLHRLGYQAYITLGNTKAIDLTVKLNNGSILTFEVKSKKNFHGSYQHLSKIRTDDLNHFVVFVNLNVMPTEKLWKFMGEPECYIMNSTHLNDISKIWKAKTGKHTEDFGFTAKALWYLKHEFLKKDGVSITPNNIKIFEELYSKNGILDHEYYKSIILTLSEF